MVTLSASYLIYFFSFFPSPLLYMGHSIHLHHVYTAHSYISLMNASVFKYVCLGNTLAALFLSASFLSRCFTLISSLWLLLGLLSQSGCLDGPHLSLSQLQLPGAPVSLCPPGIKAYSRGDVCIPQPLRTPEGTVTWQTQKRNSL